MLFYTVCLYILIFACCMCLNVLICLYVMRATDMLLIKNNFLTYLLTYFLYRIIEHLCVLYFVFMLIVLYDLPYKQMC